LLYDQGAHPGLNADYEILQTAGDENAIATNEVRREFLEEVASRKARMLSVMEIARLKRYEATGVEGVEPSSQSGLGNGKEKNQEGILIPQFIAGEVDEEGSSTQEKVDWPENTRGLKRKGLGKLPVSKEKDNGKNEKKRKRMNEKESETQKVLRAFTDEQASRSERMMEFQREKMEVEFDLRREENRERQQQFVLELKERKEERKERREDRKLEQEQMMEDRERHARSFALQFKNLEMKLEKKSEKEI
jgi:hypothetical protein